jgi:hypothetical protein
VTKLQIWPSLRYSVGTLRLAHHCGCTALLLNKKRSCSAAAAAAVISMQKYVCLRISALQTALYRYLPCNTKHNSMEKEQEVLSIALHVL